MHKPSRTLARREGWKNRGAYLDPRPNPRGHRFGPVGLLLLGLLISGCSVKKVAVNSLARALTQGSETVYAQDDDPELVGSALPFLLKTIETLLQAAPENRELLLAAASGFVQYAHAYVLSDARALRFSDLAQARAERERARRLFMRGYRYGLRALLQSISAPADELKRAPELWLRATHQADVPALYWTAAALGSAISVDQDNMALVADLPLVRALLNRALELDESWGQGALHEFLIVLESGSAQPGALDRAQTHFNRALALKKGRSITPLVTFAETVCVKQQDRRRFTALLQQALALDADAFPETRLANLLAQHRARILLQQTDYLFFADDTSQKGAASSASRSSKSP